MQAGRRASGHRILRAEIAIPAIPFATSIVDGSDSIGVTNGTCVFGAPAAQRPDLIVLYRHAMRILL